MLGKVLGANKIISSKVKHFLKTAIWDGKWLSIYSRGLFDPNSDNTRAAAACANELLKKEKIKFVFFSSESKRLYDLIEDSIHPAYALITIQKKFADVSNSQSNTSINEPLFVENGLTALEDWYIVGEADYCMTPTPQSSFSSTALMRTSCRYILYTDGSNCSVDSPIFHTKPKNMVTIDPPKAGTAAIDVEQYWKRVPKQMVSVNFSAVADTTIDSLRTFWLSPPDPNSSITS